MKRFPYHWLILCILGFFLGSCRTIAPAYNYQKLAKASIRLGIDIDMEDNHALYVESANDRESFSFNHIYVKIIFQFLFCRSVRIVNVTDDVPMFH